MKDKVIYMVFTILLMLVGSIELLSSNKPLFICLQRSTSRTYSSPVQRYGQPVRSTSSTYSPSARYGPTIFDVVEQRKKEKGEKKKNQSTREGSLKMEIYIIQMIGRIP